MNVHLKTLTDHFQQECNAEVARLSHLFSTTRAPFELAYFHLLPGDETIEHHHDEQETFICLQGNPLVLLDKQSLFPLKKGEILLVEKNRSHKIINNTHELIIMIAVWWHEK